MMRRPFIDCDERPSPRLDGAYSYLRHKAWYDSRPFWFRRRTPFREAAAFEFSMVAQYRELADRFMRAHGLDAIREAWWDGDRAPRVVELNVAERDAVLTGGIDAIVCQLFVLRDEAKGFHVFGERHDFRIHDNTKRALRDDRSGPRCIYANRVLHINVPSDRFDAAFRLAGVRHDIARVAA